jgi:hypothetical protein
MLLSRRPQKRAVRAKTNERKVAIQHTIALILSHAARHLQHVIMRRKVRSIVQVKAIVSTENKRSRAYLVAIVMLAIAFISATVLRSIFSSTDMYQGAYDKLNEKRNNVIALTTAATVAS